MRAEVGGDGGGDERVGPVHENACEEHERGVPGQRDAPVYAVEEEGRYGGEGEARRRQRPRVEAVRDVAGEDAADDAAHVEQS